MFKSHTKTTKRMPFYMSYQLPSRLWSARNSNYARHGTHAAGCVKRPLIWQILSETLIVYGFLVTVRSNSCLRRTIHAYMRHIYCNHWPNTNTNRLYLHLSIIGIFSGYSNRLHKELSRRLRNWSAGWAKTFLHTRRPSFHMWSIG